MLLLVLLTVIDWKELLIQEKDFLKKKEKKIFQINFSNQMNNEVRTCSNCFTQNTPMWRRGPPPDYLDLCNACGCYYYSHDKHRPQTIRGNSKPRGFYKKTIEKQKKKLLLSQSRSKKKVKKKINKRTTRSTPSKIKEQKKKRKEIQIDDPLDTNKIPKTKSTNKKHKTKKSTTKKSELDLELKSENLNDLRISKYSRVTRSAKLKQDQKIQKEEQDQKIQQEEQIQKIQKEEQIQKIQKEEKNQKIQKEEQNQKIQKIKNDPTAKNDPILSILSNYSKINNSCLKPNKTPKLPFSAFDNSQQQNVQQKQLPNSISNEIYHSNTSSFATPTNLNTNAFMNYPVNSSVNHLNMTSNHIDKFIPCYFEILNQSQVFFLHESEINNLKLLHAKFQQKFGFRTQQNFSMEIYFPGSSLPKIQINSDQDLTILKSTNSILSVSVI
ncbi:gata-type transcription factor srea [Anaeramoeba ignava]|uniref:Gata-type transcription factor srea n=1 Tax=Anaeramoeba ignava TaxID=1746090 RepID=A0A9Q0LIM2_ANAIG|nr:gata-type transcription factor srea [Anaeramoeba ignava]